jgi:hypothetical protein
MSDLLFGILCFSAGVLTAAALPRVYEFGKRLITKTRNVVDRDKQE